VTSRVLVALRVAAPPERVFEAFTAEIGEWWRPHALFRFTDRADGRLAIDPRPGGRVTERYPDGGEFQVGRIVEWEPPRRVVLTWRADTFPPDVDTSVHVRFEDVGGATRVVVEHFGWDGLPQDHVARHTFPLFQFELRLAEWWQSNLESLAQRDLA